MAAEVADTRKPMQRSPPRPVTGGSLSGVVVKSLAEIKREKISRVPQHPPADETRLKASEPAQRNRRESKIQLYTVRGRACLFSVLTNHLR